MQEVLAFGGCWQTNFLLMLKANRLSKEILTSKQSQFVNFGKLYIWSKTQVRINLNFFIYLFIFKILLLPYLARSNQVLDWMLFDKFIVFYFF